jgi:hypothetical protein
MDFYSIDDTNFPIIKIKLIGDITKDSLNKFFNVWLNFYKKKKNFYLLFDICEVNNPSIKNGFQLARFIQKIKNKNPQYLKKSILILNNNYIIRKIMGIVFKITPPAAPLYLYWKHEYEYNVNNDTIQEIFETRNEKFQKILP